SLLINISKLFIYGSLFLSIAYLITVILINGGIIPFKKFYALTSPTEEFFYRGELAFFYKGFIFLSIGLIFVYFIKPRYWVIMTSIIIFAIILTFTRGFIFALLLTAFTYLLLSSLPLKVRLPILFALLTAAIALVYYGNNIYSNVSRIISKTELNSCFTRQFEPDKLLGNREFSDNERKKQLNQVLERTTITSAFIGHGFGVGVPVRPVHMEVSYLEIFHKQGLLGLLFWGAIFFMLTKKFLDSKSYQSPFSKAFYFSSLFIFFQSATNQYFNNPIGMSFILLALVCLELTSKKDA
ncbi:O-antigen ligase family protein, partial [Fulvivirga kasyanovii]